MKKMYAKISVTNSTTPIAIQDEANIIYNDYIFNYNLVSDLSKVAANNDVDEIVLEGIGTYIDVVKDKILKEYCSKYSKKDIKISVKSPFSYD